MQVHSIDRNAFFGLADNSNGRGGLRYYQYGPPAYDSVDANDTGTVILFSLLCIQSSKCCLQVDDDFRWAHLERACTNSECLIAVAASRYILLMLHHAPLRSLIALDTYVSGRCCKLHSCTQIGAASSAQSNKCNEQYVKMGGFGALPSVWCWPHDNSSTLIMIGLPGGLQVLYNSVKAVCPLAQVVNLM